jgi:hypothetical protein
MASLSVDMATKIQSVHASNAFSTTVTITKAGIYLIVIARGSTTPVVTVGGVVQATVAPTLADFLIYTTAVNPGSLTISISATTGIRAFGGVEICDTPGVANSASVTNNDVISFTPSVGDLVITAVRRYHDNSVIDITVPTGFTQIVGARHTSGDASTNCSIGYILSPGTGTRTIQWNPTNMDTTARVMAMDFSLPVGGGGSVVWW